MLQLLKGSCIYSSQSLISTSNCIHRVLSKHVCYYVLHCWIKLGVFNTADLKFLDSETREECLIFKNDFLLEKEIKFVHRWISITVFIIFFNIYLCIFLNSVFRYFGFKGFEEFKYYFYSFFFLQILYKINSELWHTGY